MPLGDQLPCAWKLHMFCLICYLFGIFFVMASFLVSIFSFGIFFCACWHLFPAFQNFFGIFSFRHFFEHLWWHLMSEAQIKRQIHSSSFKRSFFVMQLSQDNRLFRQYGEGNRPQNYLGPVEEGKVTSQKILWYLKKSCEISKNLVRSQKLVETSYWIVYSLHCGQYWHCWHYWQCWHCWRCWHC